MRRNLYRANVVTHIQISFMSKLHGVFETAGSLFFSRNQAAITDNDSPDS